MFHPKLWVVGRFLDFVACYIPLTGAHIATLGGEGIEAGLWKQKGIEKRSGWLIECRRALRANLIRNHRYRNCPKLKQFPRHFQSAWGKKQGLDGFHLDRDGTYETDDKDFQPTIPLLMKGAGRCLAVTVADQRLNQSLKYFRDVWTDAERLFGENGAQDFFQMLLAEQRQLYKILKTETDPEAGAQRELGFAVRLISALYNNNAFSIDLVERYFYVSRRSGRPFRMRTYMFHFARSRKKITLPFYADNALRIWRSESSSINVVSEGGLIPVKISHQEPVVQQPQPKEVVPMKQSFAQLEKLAEAAQGQALEEFRSLVAALQKSEENADIVRQVRAVLNGKSQQASVAPAARAQKNSDDLDVLLELLRMQLKGEDKLEAAKRALAKSAYGRKKNGYRRAASAFARTQGKFRGQFAKRVLNSRPELFDELAGIYGKTTAELRKEAEAA